jgi:hypothetical protein
MTAFTKIACALLLSSGLAAPALAAPGDAGSGPTTGATPTNDAGSGPTNGAASMNKPSAEHTPATNGQSSMNGQNGMNGQNATNGQNASAPGGLHISQKLRNDLTSAGFTDIHIMPESFMVRAKDSQGNPVMMVINPDSVTAITEEVQSTNSASTAKHGATNNNNSNSAGATPGPSSTGGSQPVTPGGATKP